MQLHGSITALVTPFTPGGALDLEAFRRLVAAQIVAGTQALVVAGSTGEAAMLDDDEYARLLRAAVEVARSRVPVLAGTGLSATAKTVRQTRIAADCGIDAALVVTPPYVRATQDGLYAHYLSVAEQAGLPVVLYNVPGRTGCDLLPETVARLAAVDGIVGIKEAVAAPTRMQQLLPLRRAGFAVLGGDDPSACAAMLAGADGVVSVASNAVPHAIRRLADLARTDAGAARALDARLQPLYEFLGCEPNPIPVKALLAALGVLADVVRLPLLPLSAGARAGLQAAVDRVAAVEAAVPEH